MYPHLIQLESARQRSLDELELLRLASGVRRSRVRDAVARLAPRRRTRQPECADAPVPA
jgi:hypothetical protein